MVDVTGIREINNGTEAQVEYTWKYDNITPFGKAFNGTLYNAERIVSDEVMMLKYDDGWRIQR